MRLLVTGGAGFIGSHVAERAVARGWQVCVVDALTYAGRRDNVPIGAQFTHCDVRDTGAMQAILNRFDPDVVAHLAAETHVLTSLSEPARFVDTNVAGTFSMVEALRGTRCLRLVHVSTDEVYGDRRLADGGRFVEDAPLAPNNPYAGSKAAGECIARACAQTYGLPLVIARPCNAYGPRQLAEKFIPRSIERALSGRGITLYGRGDHIREWIYVEDLAEALLTLCAAQGVTGRAFNIGTGFEATNLQIADAVRDATGSALPHEMRPQRPGDDRRYHVDSTAMRALGWAPRVRFVDGLSRTVDSHRAARRWAA